MCIFKSDKFKSQIMRDKMMVKQCGLYWTGQKFKPTVDINLF